VNRQVETHQIDELVILVAQHVRKVGRPVLFGVNGTHARAIAVEVAVDNGSHRLAIWQLSPSCLHRHTGKNNVINYLFFFNLNPTIQIIHKFL